MRFPLRILMVLCVSSVAYAGGGSLPGDVVKFKESRDLCDHFRGEDAYDEERRVFLVKNIDRYCRGTDKELARLRAKYADSDAVLKALADYESVIEVSDKEDPSAHNRTPSK